MEQNTQGSEKPTGLLKKIYNVITKIGFWLLLLTTMITLSLLFSTNSELKLTKIAYEELSKQESSTTGALNRQLNRADSMNKILNRIEKYMPMASSLQYRDSICSKLPHESGDEVWLKPDSGKYVVKAVIIKGGKWQHTVSYILRDSAGKEIEVEPEILY